MGQQILDEVWAKAHYFIQDCPCHSGEAMHGHPIRLYVHASNLW